MQSTRGRRPPPTGSATALNVALTVKPFTRLARVHAGSTAGDAMVAAALAGTIFFGAATGEARSQTFLYLLLTMAPFAVVAPLIGPALDRARNSRRLIVIGTIVARAALCFALIGRDDTLLLYPLAFSILVLQKGYGIARSSLVPAVVATDEELVEANSKLQLISALMGFVGVAPAALLFALFDDSPGPALVLAVGTFAFTASLALRLPKVPVATSAASPEEKAELRTFGVLLAAGGMGLLRGIVGYLTLYFAFHFREVDDPAGFAIVAVASLIGSFIGTIVSPRVREWWPEERMLISVLVLTTVAAGASVVVGGVLGGALLGGAVGIAATAGKLAFDSIVQRDAPDANRGRLFARFETRFQLIWVVGAMLGLIELSELRVPYLAVGLVAGFAAFSYIVGLAAWRHRLGETSTAFGRQAVLIDQAMTQVQDRAKHTVRSGARAVVGRVRPGRAPRVPPRHLPPGQAGPGLGGAMDPEGRPVPVSVGAAGTLDPWSADPWSADPTVVEAAPTAPPPPAAAPAPPTAPVGPWPQPAAPGDDPTRVDRGPVSPDDPTVFDPRPAPPRGDDQTDVWPGTDR